MLYIPETLQNVYPLSEQGYDVVSSSIECGTVEDIRIEVSDDLSDAIADTILKCPSPSIQEMIEQGLPKLPARTIEVEDSDKGVRLEITTIDAQTQTLEFLLPYDKCHVERGLGGGAFNTTVDSAIINYSLFKLFGMPVEKIPTSYLYLTFPEHRMKEILERKRRFPNLRIIWVDGKPRRSIFIKNRDSGEEIFFSTQLGEVNPNTPIHKMKTPRFMLLHNQPDEQLFWDIAERVRNDMEDHSLIWSVGSNQIRDGIDRYGSHISICETMTLNLGEALAWIRKSGCRYIRDDSILLQHLEEFHNNHWEVGGGSFVRLFGTYRSEIKEQKSLVLPKDPEKRRIIAQRLADILHKFGVSHSIFITDGSNPTIVSYLYEDPVEKRRKKVQYYVPIIDSASAESIDRLIADAGFTSKHKDATGCGDSFTATVLALKQVTHNRVEPTAIAIMANYIARYIYALPFSNLLEIEERYPGLTEKIILLALENIDRLNTECKTNNRLPVISDKARTHSLIFQALE
jgi:hypothetical protein